MTKRVDNQMSHWRQVVSAEMAQLVIVNYTGETQWVINDFTNHKKENTTKTKQ